MIVSDLEKRVKESKILSPQEKIVLQFIIDHEFSLENIVLVLANNPIGPLEIIDALNSLNEKNLIQIKEFVIPDGDCYNLDVKLTFSIDRVIKLDKPANP